MEALKIIIGGLLCVSISFTLAVSIFITYLRFESNMFIFFKKLNSKIKDPEFRKIGKSILKPLNKKR